MEIETTYYLIHDHLVGKQVKDDGYRYHYLFRDGKWAPDEDKVIMDHIMGYDPYEPADSPYAIGSQSIMDEMKDITEGADRGIESVHLAEIIAAEAHRHQLDKGGYPYIGHPKAVAEGVASNMEKTVAWLHDVVEDTEFSLDDIGAIFGETVREAVDAVTRREGEDRSEYLKRVRNNQTAAAVKLSDLRHNSDLSRISNRPLEEKDYNRVKRYQEEMCFLSDGSSI